MCLSEEIKDDCIAIIQKQIIMKIIIWWQESYKTSKRIWKDSRGMVLASPSASQTRGVVPISKPQKRSKMGVGESLYRKSSS